MILRRLAHLLLAIKDRFERAERLRTITLAVYYLAILVGLLVMYGQGQFTAPSYIYQGF